jgi:oligoendopeptidase F
MLARSRFAALALTLAVAVPGGARERSEIPERYRWDLSHLYPSEAAWDAAREALARRLGGLPAHRGTLGASPEALRRALDDVFGASLDLSRLFVYAMARSDEDSRRARPREMLEVAQQLAVEHATATSWLRPELLALDPARVRAFAAAEPGLEQYRFFLEEVLRWRPHTLGPGEERVAAEAGNLTGAGGGIAELLLDADLPWPTVKLSRGEEARLDPTGYSLHRASPARPDRALVFEEFFGALRSYERTLGAALHATVRAHVFERNVRGFRSSLEASLFRDAIPPAVYRQLLADVRRSLPTFHRYLALRKRMLGVEVLRYEDLYVPLVPHVDPRFGPEEARDLTLAAFAPLGAEYVGALAKGYESGWTDYLPSAGKRSGAYSIAVYGVHPYQLLNFNGRYDDVSTLAHEAGHSMHAWLAARSQPYATWEYATFIAEVASTLNEDLLLRHMLSRAKDDEERLFLLGAHLDGFRATLFRQAQFAEFELAIHERVERGEALSGEALSGLYLEIAREYHGHDRGGCDVPELVSVEWAMVPHFHRDFYVYQYATSFVAATALSKQIRDERKRRGTGARDRYLAMLRAGGSAYPIDLLRDAGVDMTTSEPFDAAMAEMDAVMDELERILDRRERAGRKRKGRP